MAVGTLNTPAFVRVLVQATPEDRLTVLNAEHHDYKGNKKSWTLLLDAFEGQGGFLDGSYLWPYPREENDSFTERKTMARYHNFVETLVDLYVRFVYTQGIMRKSKDAAYMAWTEDVDGAGTHVTDFLKRFASVALVTGHAGLLVDKTTAAPAGPTQADEQAHVVLSVFTAKAIPDWRFERTLLTEVKLLETAGQPSLAAKDQPLAPHQYLLWDKEGWARFDARGELVSADTPNLGLVPLVLLRPKPSQVSAMLGRALVSNANVVRALYNRTSEEDQVLRDQAFSVLTVSVDKDGDVNEARQQLGSVIGTAKALIVKGTIKYETPDQAVPDTIRQNVSFLIQELYRAAHVRYKGVSLRAESGESIRMQYSELNEMLQGFAKGLAQCERDIARAYYAWTTPTPEAADAALAAADLQVEYPSEFFVDDLLADLQAWQEGIGLALGKTMVQHIKKKAVRRIDPELTAETLATIDAEIEAMPDDGTPQLPMDTGQPQDGVPGGPGAGFAQRPAGHPVGGASA